MRRTKAPFAAGTHMKRPSFQVVPPVEKRMQTQKPRSNAVVNQRAQKNGMRIAECTEKRIPFAIFAYCLSVVTEEEDKSSNSFCARILLRIAFITLSISLPSV